MFVKCTLGVIASSLVIAGILMAGVAAILASVGGGS